MKRNALCLLAVSCVLFAVTVFGGERKECEVKRPFIDLWDLMTLYMIPALTPHNRALSWWTGAQPDSPIEWKTCGVEDDKREGEVIVTIDGKPLHVLKKYVEPAKWPITLAGSRSGIDQVELMSPFAPFASMGCEFDFETQLRKRRVPFKLYRWDGRGAASYYERVYEIEAPHKKPVWIHHVWSCGSAGCSASFHIFLNKEAADNIPDLVAPDVHLEG